MITVPIAILSLLGLGGPQPLEPEGPVDRYDWQDTLRGQGTTMDVTRFSELVVDSAPSLDRSRAAAAQAVAAAAEVRTQMLPRFDASLRYTRLFQPDNPPLVAGPTASQAATVAGLLEGVDDPEAQALLGGLYDQLDELGTTQFPVVRNQYALRLQASYPLSDVFATILPAYREAKAGSEANRALVRAEQAETRLRAHEAYFSHVRARSLAAVAETGVRRAETQYEIVTASRRLGAATQADVLRARARLAEARIGAEAATAGVDTSQEVLRTLAHLESGVRVAVADDALAPLPPLRADLGALQDRGERERAELEASKHLIAARNHGVARRRGESLPKLAVVGGMDTARPNTRIVPLSDEFQTSFDVSVVLSWSPNDMLTGRRRKQQAQATLRQAEADRAQLRDGVRIEVASAYFEYRRAWASTKEADAAVSAAEENYRAQLERWKQGAAQLSDLIDADAEVTRAYTDQVDANVSVHLAHAQLTRATGRLAATDFAS